MKTSDNFRIQTPEKACFTCSHYAPLSYPWPPLCLLYAGDWPIVTRRGDRPDAEIDAIGICDKWEPRP
jgi:hypothetical protein